MPRSAILLGAIQVIVSGLGWLQAGQCKRFVCMGRVGQGEFQHSDLYGTWRPAAIHVGMLPDCSKPGLGVWEISIAIVTGTNVMAGCASAAPDVLHQPPYYPELYQ